MRRIMKILIKKMMNECYNLLSDNVVLLVLTIMMGIGLFLLLWYCSIDVCLNWL